MMKNLFTLILSVILLNAASAQKAKLSPQSRLYMMHAQKLGIKAHQDGYVYKTVNNTKYMSTMIKVGTVSEATLNTLGAKVGTKAGNIWTVQVPIQNLEAFINTDGIEYIQFDEPIIANMDTARVYTHVDSVHAGIDLPMPYTGKDVVVGIIDAGFDYSQVSMYDILGTTYRVKRIWEQKKSGTPPLSYFYGNELTTQANMLAAQTDAPNFSHGSHVQGIAAGSGFGGDATHTKFRGMAYESDLVLVGITPSPDQWTSAGLSDIVDGMSYVFNYASVNSKPAVANLSWGCTTGPHDGTSIFSQACDNLTGPGKIFVCSAGNNGQDLVHFNKTFTGASNIVRTTIDVPLVGTEKRAWVDAWGEIGESFCLEAALYDQQTQLHTINAHCTQDSAYGAYDYYMIGQNNDTCFISIVIDSASYNSEPRIFLDIYNKTANMIVLTLTGNSGTVNMWTGYVKDKSGYYGRFITYPGIPDVAPGNTNTTVSDISSSNSALAIGAYTSKNIFTNISGNSVSYTGYAAKRNIAPFSSKGPTVDGRTKPDITAPGLVLGSSVSSYDTNFANVTGPDYEAVVSSYFNAPNGRTYQYAMLMGTSMSSPAAAGIVALMLQADPTLDPAEVRDILKATAILDTYTGAIPAQGNNTWGWGKINAYRAIKQILEGTGIKTVSSTGETLPCILYPNPSKGNYNIDYNTDKNETLQIEVFNITGAKIISRDWKVNIGANSTTINMQQAPKGVYFTKLTAKSGSVTVKMTIE